MLTVFCEDHRLHFGPSEMFRGKVEPWFEKPSRADMVLNRVMSENLGDIVAPHDFGLDVIHKVHDEAYVSFIREAWGRWVAAGRSGYIFPSTFPTHKMSRQGPISDAIVGQMGYYSFDNEAPISEGTWKAVYGSAQVALTAQDHIRQGARAAFGLCRPPGHHAGTNFMGGYCYLNNAALAAQAFLEHGAKRVAILDVDYHHGNGTQDIFYQRKDVLFASIHATPQAEYPYFVGHKDERGESDGEGFNFNYPLELGIAWQEWSAALEDACKKISAYAPDAILISLGVDTFEGDPISQFKLRSTDFIRMGERIADLGLPTLFIMEGGYAVSDIGVNAVNVLLGFEGRSC